MRRLARALATKYPRTVHLVTTFDSGGSSAILRKTFAIPAVGDLRNRMLSLADPAFTGPEVINLWNTRFPTEGDPGVVRAELLKYAKTLFSGWNGIPEKTRDSLLRCLRFFFQRMPDDFEARGASLGNLFVTGAFLEFNREFIPAVNFFSQLLRVRGVVLPITNANLHLGARLKDGATIIGQHLFKSLPSPVDSLFLTVHESAAALENEPVRCFPDVFPEAADQIRAGKVIVYPMGSFYSSIVANLVPRGVGAAVAATDAVKIFIPNTGKDPESLGLTIPEQARTIINVLRKDAPDALNGRLLQYALIDRKRGVYPGSFTPAMEKAMRELGVRIIDRDMIYENDPRAHDPEAILKTLREFAEKNA